jgi:hypothetical protein
MIKDDHEIEFLTLTFNDRVTPGWLRESLSAERFRS